MLHLWTSKWEGERHSIREKKYKIIEREREVRKRQIKIDKSWKWEQRDIEGGRENREDDTEIRKKARERKKNLLKRINREERCTEVDKSMKREERDSIKWAQRDRMYVMRGDKKG